MNVPPASSIDGALGLVALLTDPTKLTATLAEMKLREENATKVLTEVQAAQRILDAKEKSVSEQQKKLDNDKMLYEADMTKTHADIYSKEEDIQQRLLSVSKREADALAQFNALQQKQAEISSRSLAVAKREEDISARESEYATAVSAFKKKLQTINEAWGSSA